MLQEMIIFIISYIYHHLLASKILNHSVLQKDVIKVLAGDLGVQVNNYTNNLSSP